MQTQYLYSKDEQFISEVNLYKIYYPISYSQYLEYQQKENIKCLKVYFDEKDVKKYFNGIFPEVVSSNEYLLISFVHRFHVVYDVVFVVMFLLFQSLRQS